MSTAKFNQWLNPDGTENYKCRAWVNFNGTGTVAIRAAGNVSSITDNGTGDYTVNFTTAMPDANYCFTGNIDDGDNNVNVGGVQAKLTGGLTAASFSFETAVTNGTANRTNTDFSYVSVAIFR